VSIFRPTDPPRPLRSETGCPTDRPSRPPATARDPTRVTRPTDSPTPSRRRLAGSDPPTDRPSQKPPADADITFNFASPEPRVGALSVAVVRLVELGEVGGTCACACACVKGLPPKPRTRENACRRKLHSLSHPTSASPVRVIKQVSLGETLLFSSFRGRHGRTGHMTSGHMTSHMTVSTGHMPLVI